VGTTHSTEADVADIGWQRQAGAWAATRQIMGETPVLLGGMTEAEVVEAELAGAALDRIGPITYSDV
jgi:hypothetical protein